MERRPGIREWAVCLLAAVVASLLAYAAAPAFTTTEAIFLDWHLRATTAKGNDQKIVLVLGGDRSMVELGNWPWPRETHAALLDGPLAGAHTVACDIFLVDPTTPEQDATLAQAMANHGNVVLGSVFR